MKSTILKIADVLLKIFQILFIVYMLFPIFLFIRNFSYDLIILWIILCLLVVSLFLEWKYRKAKNLIYKTLKSGWIVLFILSFLFVIYGITGISDWDLNTFSPITYILLAVGWLFEGWTWWWAIYSYFFWDTEKAGVIFGIPLLWVSWFFNGAIWYIIFYGVWKILKSKPLISK